MKTYIAFLRGINVGGHHRVPMAELVRAFKTLKYGNVRTLLVSGNVIFTCNKEREDVLAARIAAELKKVFGFDISTVVFSSDDIEAGVIPDPYARIQVTVRTRLYVTLLPEAVQSSLKLPYTSPDASFTILNTRRRMVFSVLDLETSGTVDAMKILEKEYGKGITTRNWNTIEKVLIAVST